MNVGQLRAELESLPDDMIVVLSSDGEGNNKSPLSDTGEAMYRAETTWSGDTYPTPEQIASDDYYLEFSQAPEDSVRALVLWPVN